MSLGGLPRRSAGQAAIYAGLLMLFAAAVAVGITTPLPEDEQALEQARIYIGMYLENLPTARISGLRECLNDAVLNSILLLLLALGGTHILGAPLILTVLFVKGMSVGYSAAFLLHYQGLAKGELILLSLLPADLVLVPVLLRGAAVALAFSTTLLRRRQVPTAARKIYVALYIKLLLGVLVAAVLHGYFTPWLLRVSFLLI